MVQPVSTKMSRFVETDIGTRVYRMSTGINESIMTAANEPSLGLYRLQEHVINTVPKLVKEKQSMEDVSGRLKGVNFDIGYDMEAVKGMGKITSFERISSDIQKAIEFKLLLNQRELEEQSRAAAHNTPPPARVDYGATGESPPILRKGGHVINETASPRQPGKMQNIHIVPKQF